MQKRLPVFLAVVLTALALPALAADPKPSEIHAALVAGNLTQAQQMIDQVLADQPNSYKAHYIAAEVAARRGNFGDARSQLARAEQLSPGLPGIDAHSVSELRAQLNKSVPLSSPNASPAPRVSYPAPMQAPMVVRQVRHSTFPWGWLFLLGGIVLVWIMISRRAAYRTYPGPVPGPMPMGGMGGGMGGPMMGGGGQVMGGGPMMGGGGGIMGGLASGLAIGAGVAAGEELVHHMMDGGERHGGFIPEAGAAEPYVEPYQQPDYSNPNSDMGGSDFGFSDDSWGGGGGGGGGGDDWS